MLFTKSDKKKSLSNNSFEYCIKEGDIFSAGGWKVIPFNEFFDTTVDDVIIAKSSLNGIFIERYAEMIKLTQTIKNAQLIETNLKPKMVDNRLQYPLGRIIVYEDYMLLALTHFNKKNEAELKERIFKQCIKNMIHEFSRTYADKPIFLPLLGSGITRFRDVTKRNCDLLNWMIYVFETCGININKPITIVLTKEVIENDEIKRIIHSIK